MVEGRNLTALRHTQVTPAPGSGSGPFQPVQAARLAFRYSRQGFQY